jgi:hypothetical protein
VKPPHRDRFTSEEISKLGDVRALVAQVSIKAAYRRASAETFCTHSLHLAAVFKLPF